MELFIRADANNSIGTGHLMRCLAPAQACKDHHKCTESNKITVRREEHSNGVSASAEPQSAVTFAAVGLAPALEQRLTSEGMAVLQMHVKPGSKDDAEQTVAIARETGAEWIIVDGYQFGADYQKRIKTAGLGLLFIDDYGHAEQYTADFVLNQNLHATETFYKNRDKHTQLLLGPRYILLRREFWPWRGWRRITTKVARKILVTTGGADPNNITLKIIQALQNIDVQDLEVRVVVGPANPHICSLENALQNSGLMFQISSFVKNMPDLIAWADLAISTGGSTVWEMAFMGLPVVGLPCAYQEKKLLEATTRMGFTENLKKASQLDLNTACSSISKLIADDRQRKRMSQKGQEIIDGYGCNRVLEKIGQKRWQ